MARYDTTSTDSDEVDSDSGYSSPLHRRKQASSGTHPVAGPRMPIGFLPQRTQVMLPLKAPSTITAQQHSIAAESLAAGSQLNKNLYTAYLQSGIGGHGKISSCVMPGCYPVSGGAREYPGKPASYTPSYRPLGSGIAVGMGKANTAQSNEKTYCNSYGIPTTSDFLSTNVTVTSNVTNTSLTPSQMQLANNSISSKSEPEQQTEVVPVGRKRRRKSRRKKRDPEDMGALSDEHFDRSRAHSSSNVSRCSTDVNTDHVLQFDDEDEFPDLKASAMDSGGGEAREGFSGDTGHNSFPSTAFLSYSDILKKQTVGQYV